MIRCTTWYQGIDGCRERTSAASPDTNAAASLVPLLKVFPPSAARLAMSLPGAVTATYGCCSLSGHSLRLGCTAPTASTPAHDAGSIAGLPEL